MIRWVQPEASWWPLRRYLSENRWRALHGSTSGSCWISSRTSKQSAGTVVSPAWAGTNLAEERKSKLIIQELTKSPFGREKSVRNRQTKASDSCGLASIRHVTNIPVFPLTALMNLEIGQTEQLRQSVLRRVAERDFFFNINFLHRVKSETLFKRDAKLTSTKFN